MTSVPGFLSRMASYLSSFFTSEVEASQAVAQPTEHVKPTRRTTRSQSKKKGTLSSKNKPTSGRRRKAKTSMTPLRRSTRRKSRKG
eukprot:CAMPEP_0167780086 /NCGR_PEP_ID=MMETSP0111_2-20121227/5160_1 /TAXON_ID=91324 /ORGANISM="Lotharella globosa, Strain CCCM811" /LENGTH=85 /DNA_ID=CAMNT_0007670555 /DNA_START=39 /DNA_END=296 /DNA_ORIENTATION=+